MKIFFVLLAFISASLGALSQPRPANVTDELRIEDFRKSGDTDDDVWDKAITAMQAAQRPLYGRGTYVFARTHTIGGSYFKVISRDGIVLKSNIRGFARIDATTAPDLTYPTATKPGPMSGSAFYFVSLIYDAYFENIIFSDFRFACSYLEPHNAPVFRNCDFGYCNVGVFCYRGSQNYQFDGCKTYETGALFIGGATCFPVGTPYANQDNYFVDGLTIKNNSRLGTFKCKQQDAFDIWFVKSILRPTVKSYAANVNGFVYPFAENNIYSTPTGRVIFAPMRNPRPMFGINISNTDMRGGSNRGMAVMSLTMGMVECVIGGHCHFEGVWDELPGGAGSTSTPYITVGGASSMLVSTPFDNLGYLNLTHKFLVSLDGNYTNIVKSKVID